MCASPGTADTAADALRHVPRAYQEEIFAQARSANVIAAFDTGTGKTLIAAMLVKWAAAQSPPPSDPIDGRRQPLGKKIIFLVPKVPLVDQQREFLANQTPLEVRGYAGSMGTDGWDRGRWMEEFREADVLVMTAQIFKNILTHGFWNMEKVSLLIFDECHHARQNHPYNMIMTDHYSVCKEKPRVFGMTASPTWKSKDPTEAINMLQFNLYAKVMAVREHVGELRSHASKPMEIVLKYPKSPALYPSHFSPTLLDHVKKLDIPGLPNSKIQIRYTLTMDELGPAAAELFLVQYIQGQLRMVYGGTNSNSRMEDSPPPLTRRKTSNSVSDALMITAEQASQLQSLADAFSHRLTSELRVLSADLLSPKVRVMIKKLCQNRSNDFHGIIFVEQRQVATGLAWILGSVEETKGWLRCAVLTGHGETSVGSTTGMSVNDQKNIVKDFRTGTYNLLVATSVAEEGLDFPACKIVIRYNLIRHMVGYLQSRGRARQQKSTYVVMIEENDIDALDRYEKFQNAEPGLKSVYERINAKNAPKAEIPEDEPDDARDFAQRESYAIPSTGASLNCSSAISILEHLCSLIQRDAYTPSLQPKYSGDFTATVQLPRALPLTRAQLTYSGPTKHTKKEAKRAVAFVAARALHVLGVLDDYLSPIQSQKGDAVEDADGRPVARVSDVAVIMDVQVVDPWMCGPPRHMHTVVVDGVSCAGLLSARPLPEVDIYAIGSQVRMELDSTAAPLQLSDNRIDILDRFTKMGIWWCVTASPVQSRPACYLAPLDAHGNLDWDAMEHAIVNEKGTYDWSEVTERDDGHRLIMNDMQFGRTQVLKRLNTGFSMDQEPPPEIVGGEFDDWKEYFEYEFQNQRVWWNRRTNEMRTKNPPDGIILEVQNVSREFSALYAQEKTEDDVEPRNDQTTFYLPQSYCKQVALSPNIIKAFHILAPLCRRVTDVFRAKSAMQHLGLPRISIDRMAEALILPSSWTKFNNQRLETLGDSVLKLTVVTYVFGRFPTKHEGQLSALKSNCISNRTLLARAKSIGLEQFLSCEGRYLRTWQFVLPEVEECKMTELRHTKVMTSKREFPRRSLQDCMEATLGASYLTGGIDMALQAGTALGLCFGGSTPWSKRFPARKKAPSAPLFAKLQEGLKYHFTDGNLLVEAVKHPSFEAQDGACYQRLEFLGDAVIELVVTTYLFNKFPEAKSGELTWCRSHALCNATFSALAVTRLQLHKYLLSNNIALSRDIALEEDRLKSVPLEDVVVNDWKYDPPKVLGDIFESVIGAIFVDCGFDYPHVAGIVEILMEDVLKILTIDIPRNPITRLLEWMGKSGCVKAKFQKPPNTVITEEDTVVVSVLVHDIVVAGPVRASNAALAKGLAAEQALATLTDDSSNNALHKICDCGRPSDKETIGTDGQPQGGATVEEEKEPRDLPVRTVREKDLDTESEPGFAAAARMRMQEVAHEEDNADSTHEMVPSQSTSSEADHEEIEQMFGSQMSSLVDSEPMYISD